MIEQNKSLADTYITQLMRSLYNTKSEIGSHFNEKHVDTYTFKYLLNGLLSLFLWYAKWVEKTNKLKKEEKEFKDKLNG